MFNLLSFYVATEVRYTLACEQILSVYGVLAKPREMRKIKWKDKQERPSPSKWIFFKYKYKKRHFAGQKNN